MYTPIELNIKITNWTFLRIETWSTKSMDQKVNEREEKVPGAGEIVEPAGAGEDDDTDLCIAQNGKLLGFLQ